MANETLKKHPEELCLDSLDIPTTACLLFSFDERELCAQVRRRSSTTATLDHPAVWTELEVKLSPGVSCTDGLLG